uniref:Uncharacterized protein LOC111132257 n=1 Tax=Crassostrea virginica TaxID=6565 RepID=A0A8B8E596_CRAVI|nr:uncharacterized protein LOC111132257 [Crassostrea virginica]
MSQQRERTFFTQSSEFQNCRTCARYNQPAKMNPSSNRRIRSTGGGVSPLNRNNSTELCLSRVQFGDCMQFTAEEKGRSPLNRHSSLVEANPGPGHVPQIWLPVSSDKGMDARLETPSDFEKPVNDLRQKLDAIRQVNLQHATPKSSTYVSLQTLLDIPSNKRKREESEEDEDIDPPRKRIRLTDFPRCWNTTKKRRREESVDDEEIKPSRKRPRLSPQSSHSWMWVRLPNGRKVLTLVSTDYLLYNCVSQVDFWSESDAETILFGLLPNGPWGGSITSSQNSVPITKENILPPKSVVSKSNPHIVDQNNNTSLHDLK